MRKNLKNKAAIPLLIILCGFIVLFVLNSQVNNNQPKEDKVYLADYKNIDIPEDLLSVSEEDISASIDIRFSALQPSLPKETNRDLVEYNDLVTIKILHSDSEEEEITTIVEENDDEYNIGLQLLGFHKGDTVNVTLDNGDYSVTIIDVREEVDELTDDNVKLFFGYDTIADLREYVRHDIIQHRVFEHCYSVLLSDSKIQDNMRKNSERSQFINRMLNFYGYPETYNNASPLATNIETDNEYSQLIDTLNSFFDEYVILRELIRFEDITVSEEEFDKYCNDYLLQGYEKATLRDVLFEYILFDAYYDHTYKILLKYSLPQERSV